MFQTDRDMQNIVMSDYGGSGTGNPTLFQAGSGNGIISVTAPLIRQCFHRPQPEPYIAR